MAGERRQAPLDGILVVDVSRLLPGAVLARQLIDLGARLIKVEEEAAGGDPLRHAPPQLDGMSAAFCAFFRGAESVCLDLSQEREAAIFRRLVRQADVVVESFRPGTMEGWGLGDERLRASNPGLVWCSLTAFGRSDTTAPVAHDLNLVACSGLLSQLPGSGVPQVQLADVTAGLLAASAILAALLRRTRTGLGAVIDQPLITGTLPFLTWVWADTAADGDESVLPGVLGGCCPAYRLYRCADDTSIAVAALEPKLWRQLVELLQLPQHAGDGLDLEEEGAAAIAALSRTFAAQPRRHWLALASEHALPITAVNAAESGRDSIPAALIEQTRLAGGGTIATPGPFFPSEGRTPSQPAPRLGQHTAAILHEFGLRI